MSMTEKVLVRVNPNCYIRYPREGGKMYSGTWGSVTRPDGKQANTWTGDEFECTKAFAKDVNESLTNHNVPFTATAEPRPTGRRSRRDLGSRVRVGCPSHHASDHGFCGSCL